MTTPSIETVRAWLGRVMIDRDGNRIGEITDIYLDNETGRPEWAVVRTGLFGLRSTFVPLAEAIETGEQVQVRHQRSNVKDAPNIEPDGQLSAAEEAELYRHYELDYDAVLAEGGPPAGETGFNRTGQIAGPGDERTGSTPTAPDQVTKTAVDDPGPAGTSGSSRLADTPSEGSADVRASGQAGPPTRQPDSADSHREPDRGVDVEHTRRETEDIEPAVTDATDPPRPTAQDPLPVGEGLSRPFVYETPGAPEAGPGIPRRHPGQVRLRRYLVTEIVTETESGQRHEVRVEREPINDAEVDARTATPTRADESIPGEPTRADSDDWFGADDDPRH
jgi:sporulation protein YlmC with PRC-barrel domain